MSHPHRIAFGITELDPGGAERMLTELVTRLDRSEWEPHVYCLGPEAHFASVLRDRQVPVTCFDACGWRSTPRVLRQWTKALRQFQPEILYGWLFHASLLGRIAGRWAKVRHILSGVRVAERRNSWHGRLDRWTNFMVDLNICVSRGVADFVEQTVGLDPRKTVVIPNAVDPEPFCDALPADLMQFGIPPGSHVLITIGRLEHQKGIDVLLDAAAVVNQRFGDAHYLIVGNGPDRVKLERQAQRLGLTQSVHWAGNRSEVAGLLATSTALVLPSRWEGMPNVVLEAMAAGKPVVATDVEGVRELVRPGLNGWVVAKENPQALADSICQLLNDSSLSLIMGKNSQDIVKKEFTKEIFIENHVKIWRRLVAGT
jgi:glycosyltransferase involved in cell wall biosynthesis